MPLTTYQFSTETKSILEKQFQAFSALSGYLIEATEKINDLNLAVIKASVDESSETAKKLLSVRDHVELLCFMSGQPKIFSERLHFYNQHLAQISTNAKSNIEKVLEEQMIQAKEKVTTMVSGLSKTSSAVL